MLIETPSSLSNVTNPGGNVTATSIVEPAASATQPNQIAKSTGALASRFEMDALPQGGRHYLRKSDRERQPMEGEENETEQNESPIVVGNPLPDLFSKRGLEKKSDRR